jgi:hypothetical protein
MVTSRDDIFRGALSLGKRDRADLIAALIESLDSEVEERVEEAWRVIFRRKGAGYFRRNSASEREHPGGSSLRDLSRVGNLAA